MDFTYPTEAEAFRTEFRGWLDEHLTEEINLDEELSKRDRLFADRLLALARAGRSEGDPSASSEHDYLYDEDGAPK